MAHFGVTERRIALLRVLSNRRHDTVGNLASEFGVSERTIRRDLEIMSLCEPIRTATGRYGGGVYVVDSYRSRKSYLDQGQRAALIKVLEHRSLTETDEGALRCLLAEFSLPTADMASGAYK